MLYSRSSLVPMALWMSLWRRERAANGDRQVTHLATWLCHVMFKERASHTLVHVGRMPQAASWRGPGGAFGMKRAEDLSECPRTVASDIAPQSVHVPSQTRLHLFFSRMLWVRGVLVSSLSARELARGSRIARKTCTLLMYHSTPIPRTWGAR